MDFELTLEPNEPKKEQETQVIVEKTEEVDIKLTEEERKSRRICQKDRHHKFKPSPKLWKRSAK